MMTVTECVDVMKRYQLPKEDFLGWTDSDKDVLCQHYYNALEHPIYDYNPYSQGYKVCESLGLPERVWDEKVNSIKEQFESRFEDELRGLVECSLSFV
jgi:hypothetical protein